MNNSSLVPTLKQLRESCKKSQREVAELVGVKQQAVSLWESGKMVPTLDKAVKLAKVFGITLEDLAQSMGIDE